MKIKVKVNKGGNRNTNGNKGRIENNSKMEVKLEMGMT